MNSFNEGKREKVCVVGAWIKNDRERLRLAGEFRSWRTNHEILSARATSVTVRSFDVCLSVVDFRVKRADGSVLVESTKAASPAIFRTFEGPTWKIPKRRVENPLKERSKCINSRRKKRSGTSAKNLLSERNSDLFSLPRIIHQICLSLFYYYYYYC